VVEAIAVAGTIIGVGIGDDGGTTFGDVAVAIAIGDVVEGAGLPPLLFTATLGGVGDDGATVDVVGAVAVIIGGGGGDEGG
jgi:hypothetical protein